MTSKPPPEPTMTEAARGAREERAARLAEAMRANLRRRKAQARERSTPPPGADRRDDR